LNGASITVTLLIVALAPIFGLAVTALFKMDTTGRALEEIEPGEVY
jgi:hypothetical protein